jgi:S-disulfanyl-L-cysteine oxidoreductase SoxD
MRESTARRRPTLKRILGGLACVALGSTAAWAFPWDIDMTDSQAFKAYEWKMHPLPDGAVSVDRFRGGFTKMTRMTPEGQNLANPYTPDANRRHEGDRLFTIYCQACHGEKGRGSAPAMDMTDGKKRYPIPPALLSGTNAVTPMRSDSYIFLTVQQGGAIMPSYAAQLDDEEIWSIVAYIRTLEGAQYKPPETP